VIEAAKTHPKIWKMKEKYKKKKRNPPILIRNFIFNSLALLNNIDDISLEKRALIGSFYKLT
jgi:hypothetical protein